ncbi:MAG: ribonuclease H [Myxococcota bacterium]
MSEFIRAQFRDDVVFAEVDPSTGALKVRNGLVTIRYKATGKNYTTRADRLAIVDGAAPERLAESTPATPKGPAGGSSAKRTPFDARRGSKGGMRPPGDAIQLWTDGACTGNPGPAGLGVLMRDGDAVQELSEYLGHGTNNIAELAAILRGLELVADRDRAVDVMTDSAYCVGLLTQGWKAKANQELIAELRALFATFKDARIIKVPGHSGVPDNEKADELARFAVSDRVPTEAGRRFGVNH